VIPDDALVSLARAHPRGTERRTLLPLRAALQSPAAYAGLQLPERDAIVRWAEARRRIRREHGVDADAANLADPLIPEARLRALVVEGEIAAAGIAADGTALVARAEREGVPEIVREIRRGLR
jgi:hypothetical protein